MAAPAYRFIDKRTGANAYANNLLIPSASPNKDRENIPRLDYDLHRNISALGRKVLLSAGRRLFAGNSVVRAAILEQATYAVSTYQPQYCGRNVAWGSLAEAWLEDNDKWVDLRGPPHNMALFRRNLITGVLRDGDVGILLTEDSAGTPKIQVIPSHRIGPWNQYYQQVVEGGPYDGARMIDGVIVDDYGRALAYRVMSENPWDTASYMDISANNMILAFLPEYPDQLRGISVVATGLYAWQDMAEIEYHERLSHKTSSRVYLIEKNPTGSVDRTKQLLKGLDKEPDAQNTAQSLAQELYDDGQTRYFKSGTGSGLEILRNDKPTAEAMAFFERQTRQVLSGMGWSYDFTVDPTGPGGAQMRIVIEKINRTVGALQEYVAEPTLHRIDGYRVAKAIKGGWLTEDVDWWKWTYVGPSSLTADAKYDSDIDLQENRAGFRPMRDVTAKRGTGYWEDVQDQLILEEKRLQQRCKEEGVDPNRIRLLTPNGNQQVDPQVQSAGATTDKPQDKADA